MQVGDKVRALKNTVTIMKGWEGTIEDINPAYSKIYNVRWNFPGGSILCWVDEKDIELAVDWIKLIQDFEQKENVQVEEAWKSKSKILVRYGDKYRVISNDSTYSNSLTKEVASSWGWDIYMANPPFYTSSSEWDIQIKEVDVCKYATWQKTKFEEIVTYRKTVKDGTLVQLYKQPWSQQATSIISKLAQRVKRLSREIPYCSYTDSPVSISIKEESMDLYNIKFSAGFICPHCERQK